MPEPFDTHAVIQHLEGLGFPAPQAEGLSQVLQTIFASQDYATKADIALVRSDIATLRNETTTAIAALRSETTADLATMRVSSRGDLTEARLGLEVKLEAIKGDITHLKWGIGLILGAVVSLVLKAYVHL